MMLNHSYSPDGGLAVLYGNIAPDGCIVKTAGVKPGLLKFAGKANVFTSQNEAGEAILDGRVKEGDVVVIRYEGPKGWTGYAGDAVPHIISENNEAGR